MIRQDSKGAMVDVLHGMLAQLGYNLQAEDSGVFGCRTTAAVMHFQRSQKLTVDGIVGKITDEQLRAALADRPDNPRTITPIETILKVPYHSQRDNEYNPNGTCNVTALAMAMLFRLCEPKDPSKQLEDELYELIMSEEGQTYFRDHYEWAAVQHINPNNVHGMLTWASDQYGCNFVFTLDAKDTDILDHLRNGPVIVSGRFTGSGHIVLVVGCTTGGDLIVHDPYGDWMRGYSSGRKSPYDYIGTRYPGDYRVYPAEEVWRVLKQGQQEYIAHFC
jgi:hypothetical protein